MASLKRWAGTALVVVAAAGLSAGFTACGGGGGGGGAAPVANTPPQIVSAPLSTTVQAGQVATFSVVASGTPPPSFQWRRNGAPVPGATSATYATPATVLADSGSTFDVVVTNTQGTATSSAATLTVTTAPPALGTYKRALAGTLAHTYGAGCTLGSGAAAAAPIVIAANGDVSWDGGTLPLSSPSATVSIGNANSAAGVSLLSASILDGTPSRSVQIVDTRAAGNASSSVTVGQGSPTAIVERCTPGLVGGIAQPDLVARVTGWMQGVSSSLSCSVTTGGVISTQTIAFSVANGQATFGARVIALGAARTSEAITATDLAATSDALFVYAAQYADNSSLGFSRSVNDTALTVDYVASNGDRWKCSGVRQ